MQNKKVLIAFDASENALRAVQYVGETIGCCSGFNVTLLYVERLPGRDMFANDNNWKQACIHEKEKINKFLNNARDILVDKGMTEDRVDERYVASCHSPFEKEQAYCSMGTSIAQEIMRVQKEEDFKTVVIGRRGVSKAEEFLFGSVSNKIIHSAHDCCVWVVE